jgi:hypothetical protein
MHYLIQSARSCLDFFGESRLVVCPLLPLFFHLAIVVGVVVVGGVVGQ